jgi:gluconolactonase
MKWMRIVLLSLPALALLTSGVTAGEKIERKIISLDPRFDKLVAPDAKVETLAGGFKWTEGTVWVKNGGYLLFSDIPNNVVNKWKEGEKVTKFIYPSGFAGKTPRPGAGAGDEPGSNGLRIDSEGRITFCEHGDRRVSRIDVPLGPDTKPMIGVKNMKKTTLADKYMGKRFNSPNDLVYHSSGDLYFTDPPYGLVKNIDDPARELDFQGVYRLKKDGTVELLTKEMSRPNGIGLSPDEKTLYVANSDPDRPIWMAYPVKEYGGVGEGKVFYDSTKQVKEKRIGLPDGLKLDVQGNLWATGPGGVLVFAPDATLLGIIHTGVPTANCVFGGDDLSVLYIAANHEICRVQTGTKGK